MLSKEEKEDSKTISISKIPTWGIILIVLCVILIIIGAVWKMFMQYKEISLAATGLGDITQVADRYISKDLGHAYSK